MENEQFRNTGRSYKEHSVSRSKSATRPQDKARDIPEPSSRAVPDSLLISFAAEPAPIVAMAEDIFFLFVLSFGRKEKNLKDENFF